MCLLGILYDSSAQTATGSWYGRADVDMAGIHNNYLTELVIKQKGTRVEGIFGYYFRDKYQSFFVHGRYNPKTREVIILDIPVIYFNTNSTVNSVDCNTNFRGVLINSKVGSYLKGFFYHDEKYKYTCPDLRVNYTLDRGDLKHDSLKDIAQENGRIWKPQADDYIVDAIHSTVTEPSRAAEKTVVVIKRDTASVPKVTNNAPAGTANTPTGTAAAPVVQQKGTSSNATNTNSAPAPANAIAVTGNTPAPATTGDNQPPSTAVTTAVVPPVAAIPQSSTSSTSARGNTQIAQEDIKQIMSSFAKRKSVLNRVLEVESDSVRVSFYDNGEIDGDSISVFINSNPVLTHQELAAKALTLYVLLDSTKEVNNLSMFAENLGRIPPNTALMVVTDGKNRYEVFMSSSLTENAMIQLKKKKKAAPNTGPGRHLSF
jgi:hypothetical protein